MTNTRQRIVFFVSLILTLVIALFGIFLPEAFESATNAIHQFLTTNFGWFYLLVVFVFVGFAIYVAFSKYGNIRLGPDDSQPEHSTASWFAMLFSAGMGVGLIFWGVAEPLNHFVNPVGVAPGTAEAADFAFQTSFLHWGIHAWAGYVIIGLALAYFQFRKGAPGLISSIFLPLIGKKGVEGTLGRLIDIFAVFATIAGIVTSLGMGTLQVNAGMNYMFGLPMTTTVKIIIIVVGTILFTLSAVSGIGKGIKILSNINMVIMVVSLLLVIIVGPTVAMANAFVSGIGSYFGNFVEISFGLQAFGDNSWIDGWTVFYWAWWIAWAPFVGSFIARISKGRTVKEFVFGVLLAPALASFIWFAAFGALGINLGLDLATEAVAVTETALFIVLGNYPLGGLLSILLTISVSVFFITSADSATFVLGMFTSNGSLNPPKWKKGLLGALMALMAMALLLAGGLESLQTMSIVAAFPFAFVMIFAMVSLVKAFGEDAK